MPLGCRGDEGHPPQMTGTPSVLFVCVHNAGRSQMAAALLQQHAMGRIKVKSAGSAPGQQINPAAVQALQEWGIDISGLEPKKLDIQAVEQFDVVITMGCGDACPIFPGTRYEDWVLEDPASQTIDVVRQIRDQIDLRVRTLTSELLD